MKLPKPLHDWQVTPKEAINIQKELADKIIANYAGNKIQYAAGLDAAFSADGKNCIAAVILWDVVNKQVIERHTANSPVYFPYIPGLLSFREAPALLNALAKLKRTPDLLMCDGQGLAHPRRLGIASHLGLFTNLPAIGCGKSRLLGEYEDPGLTRGAKTYLKHKNEIIGTVLRTKNNTKPIFVSIGHMMDLEHAEAIVLQCHNGYRLPEPTRLADKLVSICRVDYGTKNVPNPPYNS